MTMGAVNIQLPEPVFRKLQKAADLTHRSVEELLAATVNATLPESPDLPDDLADELAAMHLLSDEALWAATEPSMSPAEQRRLNQLNHTATGSPSVFPEKYIFRNACCSYPYYQGKLPILLGVAQSEMDFSMTMTEFLCQ